MIFIHSGFRTGSTYLWSCLRKSPRTVAYYEILHEVLATLLPAQAASVGPEGWHSKHPPSAPYFLEFLPLLRSQGGIEGFDPSISYERFIPADGCGGAVNQVEASYLATLIGHAEARGRIPVLTSTRSLGRVRGLKAACPGLHVLLYRGVFQQWCSFTDQAFRGNPYFLDRILDILRLSQHDAQLSELQQVFPVGTASVYDANTFYTFVFLHLYLYAQSAGSADLVVDLGRLEADPTHRQHVEQRIAAEDVVVDLSGAANSIAYSLCRLGSAVDVTQKLKVIGDLVVDRAPDAAGREFGAKVLSDLIEEYARHEFQAGALRSVLLAPAGLLAERDSARLGRDAALAERDAIRIERDGAAAERDAACTARDAALAELDAIRIERDGAAAERDALSSEHRARRAERDAACTARDAALSERDAALAEQDAARLEQDRAVAAHDGACGERDAALEELRAARGSAEASAAINDQLRIERDCLAADCAAWREWAAADRDALTATVCWRLTRPLRKLGIGRPIRPTRPELRAPRIDPP